MFSRTELIKKYTARYPNGKFSENEPMSAHTTFRIGGEAAIMFFPSGAEETAFIAGLLREERVPTLVIGNGSNMLVEDGALDLAVIKIGEDMGEITVDGNVITAGAGALLGKVSAYALFAGLAGLEFAGGIPASVGGAVYMNSGAYGGEIKNVLKSVTVIGDDLTVKTYAPDECDMAYRRTRFMTSGEIIVSAEFELAPGDKDEISALMQDYNGRRRDKQPLQLPSAGSFFKRPEGNFAGALIEQAGLKGLTVGGAQVSEKHAGFIVNIGGATFDDVVTLMEKVQKEVYRQFDVMLEPEVRIIRR